ncbi:hypothetical protein D3Z52_19690 [Clostridiaceae bacterium]|nr:hypothetical protein [Clostridiaceae bacterium]NBI83861.1 hypothetical protein [Clostridiaceae bacterium]
MGVQTGRDNAKNHPVSVNSAACWIDDHKSEGDKLTVLQSASDAQSYLLKKFFCMAQNFTVDLQNLWKNLCNLGGDTVE